MPAMLQRRTFLLAGAVLGGSVLPAFAAPPESVDFDWLDASRERPVPARFYAPGRIAQGRPAPLVVFSHGLGGSREGYSYLGRYLAADGVACLHVQHVGSDRQLWRDGNPFALLGRVRAAARDEEAKARAFDVRFALDQLMAGPWGERIDLRRVVAAGHSYGANTSMLVSGANAERNGEVVNLRDARVSAAVLISAPPFFGGPQTPGIFSPITVPTLHITATEDVIRIPGYYSGVDDRLAVFEAMGSRRKCLAVFSGGAHSVFTDRRAPGGYEANAQIKAATCQLVRAFLRDVFEGDASAVRAWPGQHPGLVSRFEFRVQGMA